ncbi:MAG TPA: DUF4238 domain-containing protein [Pyrinomonadaceae bacterium]|nr:DUF4238 domain-containing protein [Pyrinomonadaceae bacterium]
MTAPNPSQFQHHVPRFYLNGWSTSVNGLHKRVWVYEQNREPRPSAIRRTGGRVNTYAIHKADGSIDLSTVEDYLQVVESEASKVFKKISEQKPLTSREKRALAVFISAFYRRDTYTFDNFVPEKAVSILSGIQKNLHTQADAGEVSDEVKERRRAFVDDAIRAAGENLNSVAAQSIPFGEEFADQVFLRMNWCFLICEGGWFVTSDCPVVFNRHRGIKDYLHGHVLFPITSKIVLWMTQWPILPNCYVPVSGDFVDRLNARIIVNAHLQVYANFNAFDYKKFVDNHISSALPRTKAAQKIRI